MQPSSTSQVSSSYSSPTRTSSIFTVTKTYSIPNVTQVNTGIIVPIFSKYSTNQLAVINQVIQTRIENPSVPIIVVINPDNGTGSAPDGNISSEVKYLQSATLKVFGYVPTRWATQPISQVETEISDYSTWYHLNGIMLDQVPNWEYNGPQGQSRYSGPGGTFIPDYLSNITAYANSLGMVTFGDAGADIPENFMGSMQVIVTFENSFLPTFFASTSNIDPLTGYNSWHLN